VVVSSDDLNDLINLLFGIVEMERQSDVSGPHRFDYVGIA